MKELFIKEIKNASNDLASRTFGKALFHNHFGKKFTENEEVLLKTNAERWKLYTELRQFFENMTGELPLSKPFYHHYIEEADFHFDKLYKKWKL